MAKIYYSGSILGGTEEDPSLPAMIVEFLEKRGHEVLSRHVAFPAADGGRFRLPKQILDMPEIPTGDELFKLIRKFDVERVDAAEYVVILANAASHGVGMEIERALLRPERGLPVARILCLVDKKNRDKTSGMIRGIDADIYKNFDLFFYTGVDDIKTRLCQFIE